MFKINADVIIFDKDGTLIDFDAFWVTVSYKAFSDILKEYGREDVPIDEILEAIGVHNGTTDIDGVLCKGTYEQTAQKMCGVLKKYGCDVPFDIAVQSVLAAYGKNTGVGEIKPTSPKLADVLRSLKARGKRLAVVTTDNEPITRRCLSALGIEELFDKIYTDDGICPPKPDPYCAVDICNTCGIPRERVLMVGDTMTDIEFATNAVIAVVGIAKNQANRERLESRADAVISDMAELLDIVG